MPVTTVLSEDGATAIVSGGNDNESYFQHRFSWSAAFAGAFVATAVTFFLIALGAGFGLALTPPHHVATPTFLTLGAIYFFAAQAFGFAVGGHLAGRLIGPAPETSKEENFRSAAHGLVVWALAVVASAALAAIGGSVLAVTSFKYESAQTSVLTPGYVGYWTDMLFRPGPGPSQASLDGMQYAQAESGNATDASPTPQSPQVNPAATPSPDMDETTPPAPHSSAVPSANTMQPSGPQPSMTVIQPSQPLSNPPPRDTQIPATPTSFVAPPSLSADKVEVSRMITVGMADGARLSQYDKDRAAALVAQDTGLGLPEAQRRVDNAEARINADEVRAADTARKSASFASLWIAFALLFGAIVSVMAAVSARWEDDRITFGWPRREPE